MSLGERDARTMTPPFLFSSLFVDLVVLGLVFTSGALSRGKRFTGELCILLAWVGALGLLYIAYNHLGQIFGAFFDDRKTMLLLLAGGLFLGIFSILFVLAGMLSRFLRRHVGDRPDHMLGLLYGIARGVMIVCVLLGFFRTYGGTNALPVQITESVTAPFLLPLTDWAWGFMRDMPWGEQTL